MKSTKKEEQVMLQSGYKGLQNFNMSEALQEELVGLELTFDKIKIPAGGAITYEIPGEDQDSPDIEKEFSGVIVFHHPVRMYYREKYNGANNPPECGSFDGVNGIGSPGGSCAKCPFNQFGTALDDGTGKGCKDRRRIYILREGEVFPLLLSLPTGSLKNLTTYIKRLLCKGKKTSMVVTRFSLKKAVNANGIAYSQAVFNVDRDLNIDEQAAINKVSEQIKAISSRVGFDVDSSPDTTEDNAPLVDMETGEIVK